jgi:hypothetical protein
VRAETEAPDKRAGTKCTTIETKDDAIRKLDDHFGLCQGAWLTERHREQAEAARKEGSKLISNRVHHRIDLACVIIARAMSIL